MFGNVYWHHAYRSIKAMLHRMVWEALVRSYTDDVSKEKFRSEFRQFVRLEGHKATQQHALFSLEQPGNYISQIQYGDLAMLNWIATRAKRVGAEFVELLAARKLFKRVLVLSKERTPDRALWEKLTAFYTTHRRNWQMKVRLQEKFQEQVKDEVEKKPAAEWPQNAAVSQEAYDRFIAAVEKEVILLVDIPADRRGSETPLEFIIEEDRRRVKIDQLKTGNREASVVWKALQDSFQESIGKLRVFCHPDHDEFLTSFLGRNKIEDALSRALKKVED
jgi:hypothetical protein